MVQRKVFLCRPAFIVLNVMCISYTSILFMTLSHLWQVLGSSLKKRKVLKVYFQSNFMKINENVIVLSTIITQLLLLVEILTAKQNA